MSASAQPNFNTSSKLYWLNGDFWKMVAFSEDTDGRYSLMDVTISAGNGPRAHKHANEDESLYIIDGEFDINYGDQKIRATAGYHVFMRRGIHHDFKNIGSEPGRLLIMFTPGGLEKMFVELGVPVSDVQPFTPPSGLSDFAKGLRVLRKYGIEPKMSL